MKWYLLILGAVSLLSFTSPARPQIGQWTPPINVSNTPRFSDYPDMAIGPNGRIHVVWGDNSRLLTFNDYDILYSVYSETSCFWSTPVQISPMSDSYSGDSRIAIDSLGRPHVVWTHRSLYPDADIYYSTLTDTGWTAPIYLSAVGVGARDPDITIDHRGYIHVVWNQEFGGAGNVVHRYFNGQYWSDLVNVSYNAIDAFSARIECGSGNNLQLVWVGWPGGGQQTEVYYSKYDGVSWSPGQNISQSPAPESIDPDIATDIQGNPHAVWTEYFGPNLMEIYYSYFNGLSWSAPQNISNQQVFSMYPSIAFNPQNICCVLFTKQMQSEQPCFVFYTLRQGSHWTRPDTVSSNFLGFRSTIAADGLGKFHSCLDMSGGLGLYTEIRYTQFILNNHDIINFPILENQSSNIRIFPNPCNQSTTITYSLPNPFDTFLSIYDIQGNLVKIFYPTGPGIGSQEIIWDGTNQQGLQVSAGTYFLKLIDHNQSVIKTIVRVK